MRVRATVSFEHDMKPVLTYREDFMSEDFSTACKTALFRAEKIYPKAKARSVVVCVEHVSEIEDSPKDVAFDGGTT